jgi:hypothetical protein
VDELVERLSAGDHDVEVVLRAGRTPAELRACIDRKYVHVRFTGTRGGTELGLPLELDRCTFDGAQWDAGGGQVHLEGALTLNFVKVRCLVDLDVASMAGTGRLQILEH